MIGKQVSAEEIGNGIWKVFYRYVYLGYFSEKDFIVKPACRKKGRQKSTRLVPRIRDKEYALTNIDNLLNCNLNKTNNDY